MGTCFMYELVPSWNRVQRYFEDAILFCKKKRFIQAKKEKTKLGKFLEKKIWGAHLHRLKVIVQIIKEEFRARSYDASYNHLDPKMSRFCTNTIRFPSLTSNPAWKTNGCFRQLPG